MAPFVKQFLRLDGNFLQKRRKAPPQTPDRRCRNAQQSPSGQPTSVRRLPLVKSGILCPGKMPGRYARAVPPEGRAAESRNGSADRLPFRMDFPLHRLALLQSSCIIKSRRS